MKRGNLLRRCGALIACALLVVGATALPASEPSVVAVDPSTLDLEQAADNAWDKPVVDRLDDDAAADDELLLEAMGTDEDSSSTVTMSEGMRKVKAMLSLKYRKARRNMRGLSRALEKEVRKWEEWKEWRRRRNRSRLRRSRRQSNDDDQREYHRERVGMFTRKLRSAERQSEKMARALRCNSVVCVINEII